MAGAISDGGIYARDQPAAMSKFRERTERHATMAGVTAPSFVCKCCSQVKSVRGRKRVTPGTSKDGYVCASCASASN